MTPLAAICVDVGGVLLRPCGDPYLRRWEQERGLEPGEAERSFYGGGRGVAVARGELSDDELWDQIAREHGLSAESRDSLRSAVVRSYAPDAELVALIRQLRSGYRTAVISNAPSSLRRALQDDYKIADAFDIIVCSAEEGLLKPDPAIYERALSRLGCPAAAAVLLDDRPANVESARELGMRALLVQPNTDVRAALRELGVIVGPERG